MKRKVIQIAESTQLISLPRKWCLANSIKKGDELDVDVGESKLTVSCQPNNAIEYAEIKITDFGILAPRVIFALYKKGVDEIKIRFEKPEEIKIVQDALHNETVGYEIVEQESRSCLIKNISSNIMGFDTMVRRTFLILLSLAEETYKSIENQDWDGLKNLTTLEESNNRFTTLCRRYLNKVGSSQGQKLGPYYCVVEELEKVADEYKYMINGLTRYKKKHPKSKEIVNAYKVLHQLMKDFYESFYKFDSKKIARMGETRKRFVTQWYDRLDKIEDSQEFALMHHAIVIMQKIFNLLGPLLILNSSSGPQDF